jgi:hypothetical protein
MNLPDLYQKVKNQFETKEDMIVPSSVMQMTPYAHLRLGLTAEPLPVREHAHKQIAEKLGIPFGYYIRMLKGNQSLLMENVNAWLQESDDRRMVRVLDGSVRAVLSDRYLRLDNYDLLEAVLPIFMNDESYSVVSCDVSEEKLHLKVTNSRISGEVRVGDVVQSGVVISNSEIGSGSLSIDPLMFRLICLNGAIMNKSYSMRRVHLGRQAGESDDILKLYSEATRNLDAQAFFSKAKDLVTSVFDQVRFNQMLERTKDAARDTIEAKPADVIVKLENRKMVTDTEGQGILEKLLYSRDLTRYGLSNAVTAYSQDVERYSRATELERLGGEIIDLAPHEWKELNS